MPTYDVRCTACGTETEVVRTVTGRRAPSPCCGADVEMLFKPGAAYVPFNAYYDWGLGREVTTLADRWKGMRQAGADYRERPRPGDLSARRDRIHQQRREASR